MKIAVIPNPAKDTDLAVTRRLCGYLSERAELVLPSEYSGSGIKAEFAEDVYLGADAVIILGGDGTILQAAYPCGKNAIPVMGINLGRIGFMAETEVENIEKACDRLLVGDYRVENRMMVEVNVIKNDELAGCYYALNDAVVAKPDARMVSVGIFADGQKIIAYQADGVIISTPTGSTGYSLSAGGPVADPETRLFIATPICAHMLGSRTALMPPDKVIEVRLCGDGNPIATVTVDGEDKDRIEVGDCVRMKCAEFPMRLIKMSDKSFYDVLISKLT